MGRKAPVKSAHFLRGLTPCRQKFSIAHQFARIAVLQSGADALRRGPAGRPRKVTMVSSCPVRGLRIDVAPAIPFLRFLLRQLEGALRRGKGDNRLMLPAVPLIVQLRRAHADARKAHLAEQGLQSQRKQPQLFIPLPQRMACVPLRGQQPWRRQLPRRPPGPSAA